ncbi:MAG: hypothetical protein HKN39_00495, partial [Flavobacteriales bacterium]|nr:hypothetical protein [Flavobacteriales bacterium]
MPKTLTYTLLALLWFSCTEKQYDDRATLPRLFPDPIVVPFKPEGGYKINQVTGDSIVPVTSTKGDTIPIGVDIPLTKKLIPKDSLPIPETYDISEVDSILIADQRISPSKVISHIIPHDSITIIDISSLQPGFSVNHREDSIKTGIPLPSKRVTLKLPQPEIVKGLPLSYPDKTNYQISSLDFENGIPFPTWNTIFIDSRGNIWIGGKEGLSKYDGNTFTTYWKVSDKRHFPISSINEDAQGNIWFGSKGLIKFDGQIFTVFTHPFLSNSYSNINSIAFDEEGNIIAGHVDGLIKFNKQEFYIYDSSQRLISDQVFSCTNGLQNRIWFANGNRISYIQNDSIFIYPKTNHPNIRFRQPFAVDNNGILLVPNLTSIIMVDELTIKEYHFLDPLIQSENTGFYTDHYQGGVYRYPKNTKEHELNFFSVARSNDKFYFGERKGVIEMNEKFEFKFIDLDLNDSKSSIRCIQSDEIENTWCSNGRALIKIDHTNFQRKTDLDETPTFQDRYGRIWFSSKKGLAYYDGEWLVEREIPKDISIQSFHPHKYDGKYLWVESWNRILKYDGSSLKSFVSMPVQISMIGGQHIQKDSSTFTILNTYFLKLNNPDDTDFGNEFKDNWGVYSLLKDSLFEYTDEYKLFHRSKSLVSNGDNNFFTYGRNFGLIEKKRDQIQLISEENGLLSNHISSVLPQSTGLTLLSDGTISYKSDLEFQHYYLGPRAEKHGLFEKLLNDKSGHIWTGGAEKGVYCYMNISSDNLKAKYKPIHFNTKSWSLNPALMAKDGNSWWRSSDPQNKNTYFLDHKSFEFEPPPLVRLNDLTINDIPIQYHQSSDSVKKELGFSDATSFYNYPTEIKLPYDQYKLSFDVNCEAYLDQESIQYTFKLNGANSKWSKPSKENSFDLYDLKDGDHIIKFCAIGEACEWGEIFEYPFSILPPWYRTWWARSLYVILGFLMVYSYIRLRTANLEKRKEELEFQVAEQTKDIRKEKEVSEEL